MVLVYGTICLDRVISIESFPKPGGYAEILGEQFLLGGEACNTANALVTWGVEVALAGNPAGTGESADLLLTKIEEKGLPTNLIEKAGRTPICEVYVSADGDRTMFGIGFREMGDFAQHERLPFRSGEWFTCDPNLEDAARTAGRLAHEAGMRLYLMDFVRDDDVIPEGCYWQSSTDWVGHRHEPEKNMDWVRRWIEKHRAFCILSDGRHGFIAGSPSLEPRRFPPFPIENVVDSTGAGDLFRAGMLLGLERGWELARCLAFASAAGALKCKYLGASSRVPTIAEVSAMLSSHPDLLKNYGTANWSAVD